MFHHFESVKADAGGGFMELRLPNPFLEVIDNIYISLYENTILHTPEYLPRSADIVLSIDRNPDLHRGKMRDDL